MHLLIDNYDSFTYNIVQGLGELGAEVRTFRNDQVTVAEVEAQQPSSLIISPGPGTPDDAGVSTEMVRHFAVRLPILGICLGHQCIVAAYGGLIERAGAVARQGFTARPIHDRSGPRTSRSGRAGLRLLSYAAQRRPRRTAVESLVRAAPLSHL